MHVEVYAIKVEFIHYTNFDECYDNVQLFFRNREPDFESSCVVSPFSECDNSMRITPNQFESKLSNPTTVTEKSCFLFKVNLSRVNLSQQISRPASILRMCESSICFKFHRID